MFLRCVVFVIDIYIITIGIRLHISYTIFFWKFNILTFIIFIWKLCTYSFHSTILHLVYSQYQGMNESWNGHKYSFITKWRWYQHGVMHLYQNILKSLNQDPTKDVTEDTINRVIRLKYSWSIFPEQLHWVQNHHTVLVCYQPKNNQVSWYFPHEKYLDSR